MRHNRFIRIWFPSILGALAVVVIAYGGYRYVALYREHRRLIEAAAQLRATVEELRNNLSLTEYERDRLTFVLDETQQHAGELEEKTQDLSEQVDLLEKKTTIDPELLKKYSKVYFLNEHYIPSELVDIDSVYVNGTGRTLQFHGKAYPSLERMLRDAEDAGLGLLVTSAYRSFGTQASLKAAYKVTYGAGTANSFSADQGYSEHQLGTTVDLTTKKMKSLEQSFDTTPEYKWLTDHADEYGFVLSYPKNNKYYIYEPWHWRFVGTALAAYLHDQKKYLYDMDQRDIDEYLVTIFD